jgi:hypothetical protein
MSSYSDPLSRSYHTYQKPIYSDTPFISNPDSGLHQSQSLGQEHRYRHVMPPARLLGPGYMSSTEANPERIYVPVRPRERSQSRALARHAYIESYEASDESH